jgi:hypothetical protein
MQATTFAQGNHRSTKDSTAVSSPAKYQPPVSVPRPLFVKLVDFLEDKWGTKVVRKKNAFYCTAQQHPIAWLNSPDGVTLVLIDSASGSRNRIQVRIEDIQLPAPIRVEHRIYQNLLCHLVRRTGGGVVRWFNKFYCTGTGRVLAELVSPDRINIFETQGLFGVSKQVNLEGYAAIEVPRDQYIHLLTFLEQEKGEEVERVGNSFYPKDLGEVLGAVLKSPATVEQENAHLLDTKILAEIISPEVVRLYDGTTKRISELVLNKRVYRKHLYFCGSCQSFIRMPYRATTHELGPEGHSLTYVSSHLVVVPAFKKRAPRKERFPEILCRFWGMERGKVSNERTSRRQSAPVIIPTTSSSAAVVKPRPVSTTMLLVAAEISVDGHVVTDEEKRRVMERLDTEEGRLVDEQQLSQTTQLPVEEPRERPAENTAREMPSPLEVRRKLRKSREIEGALRKEENESSGLPELEIE